MLRQTQLIRAVRHFKSGYGMPLWKDAVSVQTEYGFQTFVPVLHQKNAEEIIHIWNFCVQNDTLYHVVSTRNQDAEYPEEYWRYDYFTRYALNKKPRSGLLFDSATSRSIYKCVYTYVEIEMGGLKHTEPKGIHCWEITEAQMFKHSYDTGGGGSGFDLGVPSDPYYGGGGGGGGIPLPSTNAPKASAIFCNQNMIAENWNVLENMIKKIIKTCMGEQLYNGLKKALNGKKLTIQFTSGSGSSFGFDGSTSGITLSTQMESNHLFHEMWHAYQAYQETAETYKNSLLNLEIEAHYAQYLYLKSLPEFANSKWEKGYSLDERLMAIKKLERYIDNKGELYDDSLESFFDTLLQYTIGSVFKGEKEYENYSFDESRIGISNFSNLTQFIKNCLQ